MPQFLLDIMAYSSALAIGITVACVVLLVGLLATFVPEEDRSLMDPVPGTMKPIWPLVRVVSYFVSANLPASFLDKLEHKLQRNGVFHKATAEEFFAISLVSSAGLMLLSALALASSGDFNLAVVLGLGVLGYFLPELWVRDTRRRRDREIIRTLPVYLEYLSMCVDAGLNFSGALRQAVDKGPQGAMKSEFRIVLRDIRSGLTRAEALRRMEERVDLKDLSVFVRAVIQAEKMGSSMKDTLQVQAQQRLDERFQRAEKMAMEAPVKLIFPLIVFIFPLTFVILLFPIIMKFMNQGGL